MKMGKVTEKTNVEQTLTSYYKGLPKPKAPKTEFIEGIATLCSVTSNTVRNWVKGNVKPNDPEHIRILIKVTGIKEENLFNNKN